jgi:hypothetical protein
VQVADRLRRLAGEDRRAAHLVLDPEHGAVGDEAQAGVVDEDGTAELLAELLDQELHSCSDTSLSLPSRSRNG